MTTSPTLPQYHERHSEEELVTMLRDAYESMLTDHPATADDVTALRELLVRESEYRRMCGVSSVLVDRLLDLAHWLESDLPELLKKPEK